MALWIIITTKEVSAVIAIIAEAASNFAVAIATKAINKLIISGIAQAIIDIIVKVAIQNIASVELKKLRIEFLIA